MSQLNIFLLPGEPIPPVSDTQLLLNDGYVWHVLEKRVIWRDGDKEARSISDIGNPSDQLAIGEVEYCVEIGALVLTLEGFSGVFINRWGEESECEPLTCGRSAGGLRIAHPHQTDGPFTSCLEVSHGLICCGDAWGAVAIWDITRTNRDPPRWILNAVIGRCSRVVVIGAFTVAAIGPMRETIRTWSLLEDGDVLHLNDFAIEKNDGCREEPHRDSIETQVVCICNFADNREYLCAGTRKGFLVVWEFSQESNSPILPCLSFQVFRRSGIAELFLSETQRYLVVCDRARNRCVSINATRMPSVELAAMTKFSRPAIGLWSDHIVLSDLRYLPLGDIIENSNEPLPSAKSRLDEIDIRKAVQFFAKSHSTAVLATRKALNVPKVAYTLGDDLIPVQTTLSKEQPCCYPPPENGSPSGAIWVKRRVKPPTIRTGKRRPLYEIKDPGNKMNFETGTQEIQRVVRLPVFCRVKSEVSWLGESDCYARTQDDGSIIIPVASSSS